MTQACDVHPLDQHQIAPIFDADECERIISAAETHAGGEWPTRGEWLGHRTIDVDALELAALQPWLLQAVQERALALMASLFGVADLRVASLRVVRYTATTEYDALPLHSDGSSLSFVCALNTCAGGGTYVRALRRVLTPTVGHALRFCNLYLQAATLRVQAAALYTQARAALLRSVAARGRARGAWRALRAHRLLRGDAAALDAACSRARRRARAGTLDAREWVGGGE